MKAIQLTGQEALATREVETPRPGPSDLLVRIRAAGVCETDVHIYHASFPPSRLPLTLGHEFSGEVAAVGSEVADFRLGDRVVVEPCIVCGECRFCRAGRPNLCARLVHLGMHVDGAFAEYVVAPARNAHRLPDGASFVAGALAEPFGCGLHGLQRARLQPGEDVLVVGDGFFGLVYTQLARALGAGRIAVLGHHAERLARAREQGADVAVDERDPGVAEMATRMTEGFGPAVVVDTVGTAASFARAVELAGQGGRIAIFGAAGRQATIEHHSILLKELDVVGALSSSDAWPELVSLLASGRIHPERLVSRVMPLDDLAEAFRLKASRAIDVVKLVITP